jgi:hypothetical protein
VGRGTVALTGLPRYARRQLNYNAAQNCSPHRFSREKAKVMTTFDKREEGFENQFVHDEELRFKATARRNKMLGLWAAGKLGLSGADADSYALAVVMLDLEHKMDVEQKIKKDFDAKGVAQSDHQITRTMNEFMAQAIADIKAGH